MSRNNRSNFYPKVTITDSDNNPVTINDFGNSFYNRFFEAKRPLTFYTIKSEDIQRFDLISYKVYGSQEYWWILAKFNDIQDVWNDLEEGKVLSVPDVLDIDDFIILSNKAQQ
jgi:hypothetical protein